MPSEAYVSTRIRKPPICTDPRYEDREKKLMMINITTISFSQMSLWRILIVVRLSCHQLKNYIMENWNSEKEINVSINFLYPRSNHPIDLHCISTDWFLYDTTTVIKGLSLFFTLDPFYKHWKSAIMVGL